LNPLLQRLALRCNFLEEAGSCLQAENIVTDCLVTDKGKWYIIFLLHCVIMLFFSEISLHEKHFVTNIFSTTNAVLWNTEQGDSALAEMCIYTSVLIPSVGISRQCLFVLSY
jgi:hypothetical protein